VIAKGGGVVDDRRPMRSMFGVSSVLSVVLVSSLFGGCAAGLARVKSGVSGKPGMMTMPDVFKMTKAKAIATLQLAGHRGDIEWGDQLCGSVIDGKIIEQGEVCQQRPAPGQENSDRVLVTLLVQPEDPRHGNVGRHNEWHLMPDVVGMPLEQAQAALRAAGFTDERTHLDERTDARCKPRIVCATDPAALERAGQTSDRFVTFGADPSAPPPKPPVAEPGTEPPAETTPPPKPPDSYF
jgi:beta-lactam-binding protein with PASTA domain